MEVDSDNSLLGKTAAGELVAPYVAHHSILPVETARWRSGALSRLGFANFWLFV
jgi:hypothetical protein